MYSHKFWDGEGWNTFQLHDNGISTIKVVRPFNLGPSKIGGLVIDGSGVRFIDRY